MADMQLSIALTGKWGCNSDLEGLVLDHASMGHWLDCIGFIRSFDLDAIASYQLFDIVNPS